MSGRLVLVLPLCLYLAVGLVQSQGSSQDAFIIQYLERRLFQIEVRFSMNAASARVITFLVRNANPTLK